MDREDAAEGQAVAVAGGSVAGVDEGIVLAPVGEFVPRPKQRVFYLAFHILDGVQQGVGGFTVAVAGARGTVPAPAHIGLAIVDRHLQSACDGCGASLYF